MRLIQRTGIDDGNLSAPDDVADGALEGERARIVAQHPPHARRNLFGHTGRQIEAPVEADVVFHRRNLKRNVAAEGNRRPRI